MSNEHTHFAHRDASGLVVDLSWDPNDRDHEFSVKVKDRGGEARFVLFPSSGEAAIEAFYHPFAGQLPEKPESHAPALTPSR